MQRLFKGRKALSPVVAAIILIAVTVAVSIAVAAWMGALTFTFMDTEQLEIQGVKFNAGNANATLIVLNPGTSDSTISQYKIGVDGTVADLASEVFIVHGDTETATVSLAWTSGVMYDIYLITSNGKQFPYRARAQWNSPKHTCICSGLFFSMKYCLLKFYSVLVARASLNKCARCRI